jgi:hypothetical protein
MVLQDKDYCILCNNIYANESYKWCKKCETNKLKKNFINWTSGNEKIDSFIQERQLEINKPWDIVFEWIPYSQFDIIKEIGKYDHITILSAKWKDGPLKYNANIRKYKRVPNELIRLNCLSFSQELLFFDKILLLFKDYITQNTINEFLNEVCKFYKSNLLVFLYSNFFSWF